jgi:hypothetical protein
VFAQAARDAGSVVMPDDVPAILWRRTIDVDAQRRRWRKLALFYGLPSGIALLAGAAIGGMGAFLGLLILLGLFGLLLAAWIVLIGHNLRANPEIVLDDGFLRAGRRQVRVDEVEAWTTAMIKASTSVGAPNQVSHSFSLAKVLFRIPVHRNGRRARRPDGGPAFDVLGFVWPSMTAEELETIRIALEPHVPGPYVPLEALRT